MSADTLTFHRWIDPAGRGTAQAAHVIPTSEAERAAIARWLHVPGLPALTAELTVRRTGAAEAEAVGTIRAEVDLVCGISLDPFVETLEFPVNAVFHRSAAHPAKEADSPSAAPELDIEADEPRAWTQHGIDLGALVAEELSLALPDFPRKPGAELPVELASPEDDAPPNPFAGRRGLTDKP